MLLVDAEVDVAPVALLLAAVVEPEVGVEAFELVELDAEDVDWLTEVVDAAEEPELGPGTLMVCPICRLSQLIPGLAAVRASKEQPFLSAIAHPKSPATTV